MTELSIMIFFSSSNQISLPWKNLSFKNTEDSLYLPPAEPYQYPEPQQPTLDSQFNFNQPFMEPQGGSQYQNPYHKQSEPPQPQQYPYVEPQPPQQFAAPQNPQGEVWNISQNKASYVVSIPKSVAALDLR